MKTACQFLQGCEFLGWRWYSGCHCRSHAKLQISCWFSCYIYTDHLLCCSTCQLKSVGWKDSFRLESESETLYCGDGKKSDFRLSIWSWHLGQIAGAFYGISSIDERAALRQSIFFASYMAFLEGLIGQISLSSHLSCVTAALVWKTLRFRSQWLRDLKKMIRNGNTGIPKRKDFFGDVSFLDIGSKRFTVRSSSIYICCPLLLDNEVLGGCNSCRI